MNSIVCGRLMMMSLNVLHNFGKVLRVPDRRTQKAAFTLRQLQVLPQCVRSCVSEKDLLLGVASAKK